MMAAATSTASPRPRPTDFHCRARSVCSCFSSRHPSSHTPPTGANKSACGLTSAAAAKSGKAARQSRRMAARQVNISSSASTLSACPQAAPLTSTAGLSAYMPTTSAAAASPRRLRAKANSKIAPARSHTMGRLLTTSSEVPAPCAALSNSPTGHKRSIYPGG